MNQHSTQPAPVNASAPQPPYNYVRTGQIDGMPANTLECDEPTGDYVDGWN